jgi:AcrR family transcriptional regulator
MTEHPPKWRRRKTDRPGEIIAAALEEFADKGFAGAKLDDIARRAGVSKGSLYLYFETKEDIFRAVARAASARNLEAIPTTAKAFEGPLSQLAPAMLTGAVQAIAASRLPAVVKMVIGESRNFPDLAKIWHDEIVSPAIDFLTETIARAQQRGEVGSGNPRLYAFSLAGPIVMAVLFREVFGVVSADLPDLEALAGQHARALLDGMLRTKPPGSSGSSDAVR